MSVFWAIVDLVKKFVFRYPANVLTSFNLTVSWIVVSLASLFLSFPMHKLWPILSITHVVMFAAVTFAAARAMSASKAAALTVPPSEPADDENAKE